MKSAGATALLTLAILTGCLGARSDQSRSRSSRVRSAPVAAEIKRDTDFECPEEFGYYPHPTDCTFYYVCVFGGALLESCTGGLMYSHELQTCDWPRNVGCDGTSVVGEEKLERLSEREPPPPPRRAPLPPPRVQPNPVVTSRGQPKFNRQEYEKQQQLYAEVDDLPTFEELETDRQQRVYRGQPPTIGQVQKDRDGYVSQSISSARNLNSNIIPASLSQNSKIGSFSFGSQVDERRTATVTSAPQSYSEDNSDNVTDSHHDRLLDDETNEIDTYDVIQKRSRRKRETVGNDLGKLETNSSKSDKISMRNDRGEEMEYTEPETDDINSENTQDDIERGKRQVRYYLKNRYKNPVKTWSFIKSPKIVAYQQLNNNPNVNNRYKEFNNNLNYHRGNSPLPELSNYYYSTPNHFSLYQEENSGNQRPFQPNLPDHSPQKTVYSSNYAATQIITKSPPISSLSINNNNLFTSLAGGFINNVPKPRNLQYFNSSDQSNNGISIQDSSQLPSTVVNGKYIPSTTLSHYHDDSQNPNEHRNNYHSQVTQNPRQNVEKNKSLKQVELQPIREKDHEEFNSGEEESSEEGEDEEEYDDDDNKYKYPKFKFPTNKYKGIVNPFANPDFDFDAYLSKLSNSPFSSGNTGDNPRTTPVPITSSTIKATMTSHLLSKTPYYTFSYDGISTPKPFTVTDRPVSTDIPGESSILPSLVPIKTQHEYVNKNLTPTQITSRPMSTSITIINSVRPSLVSTKPESQNVQVFQNQEPTIQTFYHQKQQQFHQQQRQQEQKQEQQSPQQKQQHLYFNENIFKPSQSTTNLPLTDTIRPKIKPPNFNDDRTLPLSYSFILPTDSTLAQNPNIKYNGKVQQAISATGKPYILISGTAAPGILVSTPKQQYIIKPDQMISISPHIIATGKPSSISSIKSQEAYKEIQVSTPKPLTTLANEQLSALQHYWNSGVSTESVPVRSITIKPTTTPNIQKLEKLFAQVIKTNQVPVKNYSNFVSINSSAKPIVQTTTKIIPSKRRLIPKPSPEMNDYYYDDDEEYYVEPMVKPKYMPSTEIKPQRPPMAQNNKEYDDSYEDDDDDEQVINIKPQKSTQSTLRKPVGFSTRRPENVIKNLNNVSIGTKLPLKDLNENINGKIPVPVLVDYLSPTSGVLIRSELSNYTIAHHNPTNKIHTHKSINNNGPNTLKPPKYLNQTTLRPYTVRHRLAKPTTVKEHSPEENKKSRGTLKHHNIVAQILSTTPRDNHIQETRFTKNNHDDKTNSLEPTESVSPASYSASPRPKMLYNGSQSYSPDQYDPFYAVYDEDGELYKDADYVQQYNQASLRPAVQQTYRGTPPPARRPVQTYTPRPSADDYDDALIQPQISNQNQYQAPIRHSPRGEGNELGYDHISSSVKTTLYEATSISTTPRTTTSTSTTTTKRPTTAPYTEAMTPRYTPRSSTDENSNPQSSSSKPSDESSSSIPSTLSPVISVSSLAKPFQLTDNSHRLENTISSTEKLLTAKDSSQVTNNDKLSVEVVRPKTGNDKKVVTLTSGFSFRRNSNNTNNPYTLTVLTRPFNDYDKPRRENSRNITNRRVHLDRHIYDSSSTNAPIQSTNSSTLSDVPSEIPIRRKTTTPKISEDYDISVHIRPTSRLRTNKPRIKINNLPTSTSSISKNKKYNINTSRQSTLSFNSHEGITDSTENSINTEALIEAGLQTVRDTDASKELTRNDYSRSHNYYTELVPLVSPYKTLDNLRNIHKKEDNFYNPSTSTSPTVQYTVKPIRAHNIKKEKILRTEQPSYHSYHIDDEVVPNHTTEIFNDKVKNVIRTFLSNIITASVPEQSTEELTTISNIKSTTPLQKIEDDIINIGYQKKTIKHSNEKPKRISVKRLQIITEPPLNRDVIPEANINDFTDLDIDSKDFLSTSTTMASLNSSPFTYISSTSIPYSVQSSTSGFNNVSGDDVYQSKYTSLFISKPNNENSQKFMKLINDSYVIQSSSNSIIEPTKTAAEDIQTTTMNTRHGFSNLENDIVSTTSTTKATMTHRFEASTTTTKSISFPTRASRVNPAIKLAATNPGSGRRSYQSPSNCSTDNSLQANPKCNEIKYQRPTSTRGRGPAHYSSSTVDLEKPAPNRGTPPTRSRPTLKPSTAIVSKSTEFVDIYAYPPSRPAPVYPQPTPDKTAAKCRKDVCLLPDCYCGGKDIPGDLPVEQVPQIVLLTFDDSVNDLNKGLYADLFEKGRVNPNGCPISATFYVSHEWTDYSQVQNLYSAGHEMASHTVSHSFGEQFSQKKWNREVGGQREILAAYGGVKLDDVKGMRAPFLSVGGNKMFKMLYDSNFTYDSSLPVYENRPPSWPYTLDYKIFHDCMIPPCPTKSYPGVWEVPMVMWQDLNGGRCSMGDACANPPEAENVYKMILKNFDRHYTTNRAPFGLFYHAAWFTQPHHKEGFIMFLDFINRMSDVWIVTNWQALQWVRDPTPISRLNNFQPFQCNYQDRPKKCNNPKVCNLWHKSGVRYMRTCQPCPEIYPWTGKSGISSSRIDNDKGE